MVTQSVRALAGEFWHEPQWKNTMSVPWGAGTPAYRLKPCDKTKLTTKAQRAVIESAEESLCSPDYPSAESGPGVACGRAGQYTMEANQGWSEAKPVPARVVGQLGSCPRKGGQEQDVRHGPSPSAAYA
jgi:hypothetical protein